ncbi:hypothetical protein LB559_16185 [Mesorhizobium sp. BR1-1-3]|uniref:hypothetical protein n=1 Tax=Mesorhizobium sp. BR1-1-3 TaxID=2876651 RepID=UPI001CD058AC|nr:hypothetical protein [Mesorhizobium sp. BR1-1-3]MBZ9889466.1 hypothetical protein [Mesorhizobium sp. BR1-1-3]
MTPGMQMFTVSGLKDDGTPGEMFFEFVVRLPAHLRENTGPNVRRVLESLRRSPRFRAFMDQYHWFAPKAGEPDECLQRATARTG